MLFFDFNYTFLAINYAEIVKKPPRDLIQSNINNRKSIECFNSESDAAESGISYYTTRNLL